MCKAIRKVLCITVFVVVAFLTIALLQGGRPFRWIGQQAEQLGRSIKHKSEEVAKEADEIKKKKKVLKEGIKEIEKVKKQLLDDRK